MAFTTWPRWSAPVGAGANRDILTPTLRIVPMIRTASGVALAAAVVWTVAVNGQTKTRTGEWTTYGGDLASTRYSPLDQINKDTFNKLEVAWRFKTDALGPRPEF